MFTARGILYRHSKGFYKSKKELKMGTWALPQTLEKAKKLQALLKQPLPAKNAESKIYDLIGDDDLFDSILNEQTRAGDDVDVRSLIQFFLESFLDDRENSTKPWSDEAIKICQEICKKN